MSAGNGTATFANAAYTYDAMGRIATVGNSADTLTYGYVPGTGRIASSSWQTASAVSFRKVRFIFLASLL